MSVWYFRARYFSDELGRFISRDPIGYNGGGYGLYNAYFAELFRMDPTGHLPTSPPATLVNGIQITGAVVNMGICIAAKTACYNRVDEGDGTYFNDIESLSLNPYMFGTNIYTSVCKVCGDSVTWTCMGEDGDVWATVDE